MWSGTSPKRCIRRGTTRISRVRCGKAKRGCASRVPPRPAGRRPHERGAGGGSDPTLLAAGAAQGRAKVAAPVAARCPPCGEVAPSTEIPCGKAIQSCRGQGRSTDRFCPSTSAGQVAGPVIHEPASTLEQVRAPVGGLDLAADLVRQGRLQDLQGATAQRDPVLAIPLRARGRDAPHALVAVASRAIEPSVMGEGEGSGGG